MDRLLLLAKTLLALVWVRSGLLRLVHRLQGPRILVLAYHRVTPDAVLATCAYPAMHVSCSSFERQLRAVRQLYRIIPMAQLRRILDGGEPLRQPVAVVTFDDGYEDNFTHAFPILTRLDVPATFFLSFGFVDQQQPFWFDLLAQAVTAWDHEPDRRATLRGALPADLVAAFEAPSPLPQRCRVASAFLKTQADAERRQIIASLQEGLDLEAHPGDARPMSWEQARRMCQQGMSMGAHSVSHAILTSQSPDRARDEVAASLDGVGRRLGVAVEAFAYPNGDTDERVTAFVEAAGARLAFTMQPRQNRPGDPHLQLGRTNVCQASSRSAFREFSRDWFWCEITGFFDLVLRRHRRSARA